MQTNQTKEIILELCSEDAHGSWEFWSKNIDKTEEECARIVTTITELIKEEKLVALEHKFGGSYVEVPFDIARLESEVRRSMSSDVDPDNFYWLEATDKAKE